MKSTRFCSGRRGGRPHALLSSLPGLRLLNIALQLGLALLLAVCFGAPLQGGFTALDVGLPSLSSPRGAAGDYDNDGDLDLVLSGYSQAGGWVCGIWRNENGRFTEVASGLPVTLVSSLAWADIDNDGDLDLALSAGETVQLWRNEGATFALALNVPLAFYGTTVQWTDYDSDGDQDLFFVGPQSSPTTLRVLRNERGGRFTHLDLGVRALQFAVSPNQRYYLNVLTLDGSAAHRWSVDRGRLVETPLSITGIRPSGAAWANLGPDKRLEVVLTGRVPGGVGSLALHQGYEGHVPISGFLPESACAVGFLDADNDGDLDTIGSQINDSGATFYGIWENSGNGTATSLLPVAQVASPLAQGDFDGDGDVDLISAYPALRLWRNDTLRENTAPSAPTGLLEWSSWSGLNIQWHAAHDDNTPTSELTYNVRIGSAPGCSDVVSAESDSASGKRLLPVGGNVGGATNVLLKLPVGTYHWRVQAVDSANVAGPFSAEASFTVTSPEPALNPPQAVTQTPTTATLSVEIDPLGLATEVFIEWGTSESYGQTTPSRNISGAGWSTVTWELSGLNVGATYHFRVVARSAGGTVYGEDVTFITPRFVRGQSLTGGSGGNPWGDFDGDGDLDLALNGLWRNQGGVFTAVDIGIQDFGVGMGWGDYDRDGDLDLGWYGTVARQSGYHILENDADGFKPWIYVLPSDGWVLAPGDFDRDGDLDLVATGNSLGRESVQIWRNTGTGFERVPTRFPALANPQASWGDYDGDGDLDLLINGYAGSQPVTRICRNDSGVFHVIDAGLPGINFGKAVWGDYDNDGDLDVALAGFTAEHKASLVWRNDNGRYTPLLAPIAEVQNAELAWGDFDNDGDLDLAVNGYAAGEDWAAIYRNDGPTFTEIPSGVVGHGPASWADYDEDGDLDLLIGAQLWRNEGASRNSPPGAPTGLRSTVSDGAVQFHWDPATDAETPSPGLTYNLRVGTAPGLGDVLSPESDAVTGTRRVAESGAAGHRTSAFLSLLNLPPGIYYWSVQAVDTGFAGGPFAPECAVTVPPDAPALQTGNAALLSSSVVVLEARGNCKGVPGWGWFEYGLTSEYGLQTIVTNVASTPASVFALQVSGLAPGTTYHYRAVLQTAQGKSYGADQTFRTPLFTLVQPRLSPSASAAAWGDYDGDGDVDLVTSGSGSFPYPTQIWLNDGGTLTDIHAPITQLASSLAWGDYDNDGDLDLLAGSANSYPRVTRIWRNDHGGFSDAAAGLPGVTRGPASWGDFNGDGRLDVLQSEDWGNFAIWLNRPTGFARSSAQLPPAMLGYAQAADYDNDGKLDLLLGGLESQQGRGVRLFRNTGGSFSDSNITFPIELNWTAVWGDYDADGDPDLLLDGSDFYGQPVTGVWRNDGNAFTRIPVLFPSQCGLSWVDFDSDGDLDIFVAAESTTIPSAHFWRNDGQDSFVEVDPAWAVGNSAFAWGDYDGDGDLDLFTGGELWRNDSRQANAPPSAPSLLSTTLSGDKLKLSWAAATDAQSPSSGLAYRVRVGSVPGGNDIVSGALLHGMSAQGWGDVGFSQHGTEALVSLINLPVGTFYWSVRAVDPSGAAGPWAAEVSFILADSDTDGMPDWWESLHGLSVNQSSDATQDSDGDGYSNAQEFAAGTDPADGSSALAVTEVAVQGQDLVIRFATVWGKYYAVQTAAVSPAGPWSELASNIAGTGDIVSVTITGGASGSMVFYRAVLQE